MPTILMPDDSEVVINAGDKPIVYRPKGRELIVDEAHVAAILGAVNGSSLKPEAPATKSKPEAPAKEK